MKKAALWIRQPVACHTPQNVRTSRKAFAAADNEGSALILGEVEAAALGVEKLYTAGVPGRLFDTVHMNSVRGGVGCCHPGGQVVHRKRGRAGDACRIPDTELAILYQVG
jgi:hypothetical protein